MSDLKQDLMNVLAACAMGQRPWDDLRTRLARATVTEPEPTPVGDADLRAQLQAALPAKWCAVVKESAGSEWCYVERGPHSFSYGRIAHAALRRPNGIRDCAAALLTLAGEGVSE